MPVRVSAVLDHETTTQLVSELLPLVIDLGDEDHPNRNIEIERPDLLEFVPGHGIRLQTSAKVHWTLAGMAIPFSIQSVRILLEPRVDTAAGRINLHLVLEDADLKNVPKVLDRSVVAQVNQRLAARPDAIGWTFVETLAVRLPLPAQMAPLDTFEMDAGALTAVVDATSLRLDLALPMQLVRRAST